MTNNTATVGQYHKELTLDDSRHVGIEIEVENVKDGLGFSSIWTHKKDDSLRNNGREFITPPILLAAVDPMLADFYTAFHENRWRASERTGIHVHIDCRDLPFSKILTLASAYILTEVAFFDQVGQKREENIYCVPWYRADNDITNLIKIFRNPMSPSQLLSSLGSLCKYSAFYLEPLRRFGTCEFRHAPTFTSKDQTQNWVECCYNLVENVITNFSTPGEVLKAFNLDTPKAFARLMLGPNLEVEPYYNERFDRRDCVILAETLAVASGELESPITWLMATPKLPPEILNKKTIKTSETVSLSAFTMEPTQVDGFAASYWEQIFSSGPPMPLSNDHKVVMNNPAPMPPVHPSWYVPQKAATDVHEYDDADDNEPDYTDDDDDAFDVENEIV